MHVQFNLKKSFNLKTTFTGLLLSLALTVTGDALSAAPLRIVTTTTDIASITRSIGGDKVSVKSLANGIEDPHFIEAKPGFIRDLARANVFIQNGMDLEVGWVPVLLKNCRNRKVLPGGEGFIDASTPIQTIHDKSGEVNRSMGDVHPRGNPHYMVDPAAGILVTAYIGERLAAIDRANKDFYLKNSRSLQNTLARNLWGAQVTRKLPPVKLARLLQRGGSSAFHAFLKKQNLKAGGWMSQLAPARSRPIVVEHRFWNYFAKTFGFKVAAAMEPIPGVNPSTAHLRRVVERTKSSGAKVILALPYFPSKHARFVAKHTGAKIALMAHMPLARPNTKEYLDMLKHNVIALSAAMQ